MQEPKIHSHIEDCLPDNHPKALEDIHCENCTDLVHANNNECMQTWIETGKGAYCFHCFSEMTRNKYLTNELALPNPSLKQCTQCPHTVGDSDVRDCCFPDCVGGWEEAFKISTDQNVQLYAKLFLAYGQRR